MIACVDPGVPRAASWVLGFSLLVAGCTPSEKAGPPPGRARLPAGADPPDASGIAGRRERFLAGASAEEAPALVAGHDSADIDAVAAFFADPGKPYPERIAALLALGALRVQDPREYSRVFPKVRSRLWEEVHHGTDLEMSPLNEKAFVEAVAWLSERKDPEVRPTLELHLDRGTVRRKRLPEAAMCAVALGMGSFPESESARDTLWAALKDPKELGTVRACCLKSLRAFYPQDLESRVARILPEAGDDWLMDLQRRLR